MELIFWAAPIAWAVALGVTIALLVRRSRRAKQTDDASLPIAHRDRLTALPGYSKALNRYRRLVTVFVASLVIVLIASVALTSRPASVTSIQPELRNRDIVLCLDVSGSMVDYDKEVLDVFGELAKKFTGERISLVVFNASAVTRFPLTTDYDYVVKQFATLRAEFDSKNKEYFSGTLFGNGSSLVGDGLASCATRFDQTGIDRSRSVILVTDNVLAGQPIFTLPQAGALAEQKKVTVYGINPGDTAAKAYLGDLSAQFKSVVTHTGGSYFALDDPKTIPSIVEQITAQQSAAMTGTPEIVLADQPAPWVWLAFLGLAGLMLLAWRLRR